MSVTFLGQTIDSPADLTNDELIAYHGQLVDHLAQLGITMDEKDAAAEAAKVTAMQEYADARARAVEEYQALVDAAGSRS